MVTSRSQEDRHPKPDIIIESRMFMLLVKNYSNC